MKRPGETLVCWHSQRAGGDVLRHAVANLRADHKIAIDRVRYLIDGAAEDERAPRLDGVAVELVRVPIQDPTRHHEVYEAVRRFVRDALTGPVHVNVSPGTPAMHAVWLALYAGGALPVGSRLWSSQKLKDGTTRIDEVDFRISTYLAEIRRSAEATPTTAQYDLEARSMARRDAFERLARYGRLAGAPLLVLGERGTGKSRLVEAVIAKLRQRPVTTVACGSLDSNLADSLLFGHQKGAFTGAAEKRAGLLQQSDGGLLFLDEVQDLPRTTQRRLVRFLQDRRRRFRPLGADKEVEVDVEVVCASNLPLPELRAQLDSDLFDRIGHLIVEVPPLRSCREDLVDDWRRVWRELRPDGDTAPEAPVTSELEALFATHGFPGNLRDLQRLAYLIAAWAPSSSQSAAIPMAIAEWSRRDGGGTTQSDAFGQGTRTERVRWFHRELARWALREHGTWIKAARALGCDEKTLRADAK
ncbi:MAG: sigma-54-dependent Fis family transcriptional regulator [Myxococcales bacterium]|nr:sigma-54-dependent Fis family transcriptional regulator [Myxococcales bacterium]